MSIKLKTDSSLQGSTRIIRDAAIGLTNLVESMHNRIVHPPLLPSTPIQHLVTNLSGLVYENIRISTKLLANGIDKTIPYLGSLIGEVKTSEKREALRSVLNGVVGDYLEKTNNPLQIKMQFRHQSKAVVLDKKNIDSANHGKVLLMVHGSCLNDNQWTRQGHNHGEALAKELGKTPIYLHYNSGRHISTNGQEFSDRLEELIENWPTPIEELVILAHSMGGLVTRSAVHYGEQHQKTWTKHLKQIVFLGTPHHGAPLERIGNYLDVILENIPYTKPFAKLGKIRSAGVTDLRYGNLVDEDWQDKDQFKLQGDQRQIIPLPAHIECFSIAGNQRKTPNSSTLFSGDGLVTQKSALGKHTNAAKDLNFKKINTWIAQETSHSDLLSSLNVYEKIKRWLS
jgi:pimeloyl-ACP methyl ester carboxylesterase